MQETSFLLRITAAEVDVDQAELEELVLQLRDDLLASGVPGADRVAQGSPPAGSRSAELIVATIGILVTGLSAAASAAQVADFVERWRQKHPRRRRVTVSVVADVAAPLALGQPTRTGRRSALLVANGTYRDPGLNQLRSPVSDIRALAGVLGEPGIGAFEVETLTDADEAVLRRRVAAFFADRHPDDFLMLHFSCHGLKDQRGRLFLAAADTELNALTATGLPASFVSEQMSESASRSVLLILDCCYSGAFARDAAVRADRTVHVADEFRGGGTGRTVLTASSATEYSFEGGQLTSYEAAPSVFTEALVTGLRTGAADLDHDGDISVDELFEYASQRIREAQAGQVPRKWTFGVTGALVVARSVRPAMLPEEIRSDLASDRPILRLAAVEALAGLLTGSRPGYRHAAHATLVDLRDQDDSVRVRNAAAAALRGAHVAPPLPVTPPAAVSPPAATVPATVPPKPVVQPSAAGPPVAAPSAPAPSAVPRGSVRNAESPARSSSNRVRALAFVAIGLVALVATAGIIWQLADGDTNASSSGSARAAFGSPVGHTTLDYNGTVEFASVSRDGKWLATVDKAADQVASHRAQVWNTSTGQVTATFDTDYGVDFSPDGTVVGGTFFTGKREIVTADGTPMGVTSDGDTNVELRDTATGQMLATLPGHRGRAYVLFSPDSKTVATASMAASEEDYDAPIRLWSSADGKLLSTLSGHNNGIQSMEFSADGKVLVSSAAGGTTKVWDLVTRKNTATLTKAWFPVWLSADGATFATRKPDGKGFELRSTPSGKLTATVSNAGSFVGFSPDSSTYATDTAGTIRLWDVATRKVRTTLTGRDLKLVAFSPDGHTVAGVNKDTTVGLWDTATGQSLITLTGHTGEVTSIVFTPDGQLLLTIGTDRTLRRWYVRR